MHYLIALVGAVLGLLLGINGGFLIGGLLGLLAGLLWRQQTAIGALTERLDAMEGVAPGSAQAPSEAAAAEAVADTGVPFPEAGESPAPPSVPHSAETAQHQGYEPPEAPPPRTPGVIEERLKALGSMVVTFATTGNPVVRIGAVVLFIGVAYLLRYAYEHSLVPVELRLAGAGLGGIVLLGFGWRLRERADTYGLILQGAGLAILYLTVFAAARLYELVPMGAAFAMLVVLVAGASVLSVVQKSQALAIFSMSGGFLAPVLTSTGEGSHVALFSYYALLNAGILGMAWFRHWRWLNWTGFVFTFVIGASWGIEYYQPEYYASTQPFLVLFFLYYLAVSVLFARRQTVDLKGVVDGTLVFGTPVIAFVLQAGLVEDMEFGLAYSALAAAAVYALLAWWLKRQGRIEDLLDESFLALAVVFATLAIPFAFDNQRFTAATWALEGAGIYWVGIRQARRLPRAFALLLQLGAGLAFLYAWEEGTVAAPTLFLNSFFLGAAFLGIAGMFTAWLIGTRVEAASRWESLVGVLMLAWGVCWWLGGGLRELSLYTPGEARFVATNIGEHLFLIYVAASLALLTWTAGRTGWKSGRAPGFLLLPIAALILPGLDIGWEKGTALADYGWLAWPLMLAVFYWHLKEAEEDRLRLVHMWHAAGWWFVTLFLTWNLAAVVDEVLQASVWTYVLWGAVPLVVSAALVELRGRNGWPFSAFPGAYFGWGWLVGLGYLLLWLLLTGSVPGDPAPLPYVVLINPLELTQLAILLVGTYGLRRLAWVEESGFARPCLGLLAAVGFLWVNSAALRAVHFYAEVAYPVEAIARSDAFLTTASILWASIALVLMGWGARRAVRLFWQVGAVLLGVVILKLFFVDMGNLDLVGRIVSFITVGVLMLVIGYLAPLPPKRMEPTES